MTLIGWNVTRIASVNLKVFGGQKAFPVADKKFWFIFVIFQVVSREAAGQSLLSAHYRVDGHPRINPIQVTYTFIYLSFLRSRACQFTTDLEDLDKLEWFFSWNFSKSGELFIKLAQLRANFKNIRMLTIWTYSNFTQRNVVKSVFRSVRETEKPLFRFFVQVAYYLIWTRHFSSTWHHQRDSSSLEKRPHNSLWAEE